MLRITLYDIHVWSIDNSFSVTGKEWLISLHGIKTAFPLISKKWLMIFESATASASKSVISGHKAS